MAWQPPTSPEDSYELSPFGFGPFPLPGQSVEIRPPHPENGGYGGVGFTSQGQVAGGSPYGLGSYGSVWFRRPRTNIDGGYGGDPYGLGGYGSTEKTPPFVASAISISAFEVQVFFSEELDTRNPALTDPSSYSLEAVVGAAPSSVLSVHIEQLGSVNRLAGDTIAGAVSVVVTHTGTTLGGTYRVHVTDLTDIAGNVVLDAEAAFLARGQTPQFVAAIPGVDDPGNQVEITFDQDMLRAVDEPGAGAGISDAASYEVTSQVAYPIGVQALTADHLADPKKVLLTVQGMTSLTYDLLVGPAFAFSYDTVTGETNATRVTTGTGTAVVSGGNLVVGRLKNNAFGLEWRDTSGVLVPGTTVRMNCTYDFRNAAYSPAISTFATPEVAEILFQDGPAGVGLLVRVTFQYGLGGVEQIRCRSGTFDVTYTATWSGGPHTLSFVRNLKAGTSALVLDDFPLGATASANMDGLAETAAGLKFSLLDGGWDLTGVRLVTLQATASTTVYSAAWNFLHGGVVSFQGSAVLTRDTVQTQRGPLVKGWGDATPATKQDVAVLVNGTEVEVAEVNPYIGKIRTVVPIPLLPPGDPQADVKVDYQWFKSPVMEFAGLNTEGLVLNKFDCSRRGHHDPASHGDQVQVMPGPDFLTDPGVPKGAVDIHRFPMGVVLGPMNRAKPLYIGHRYMGFERAYSALTNSPTTLVLNQAPNKASVPGFERTVQGVSVAYEGLVQPQASAPAWALSGTDSGGVDHSAVQGLDLGTYTVIDAKTGPYVPTEELGVVYRRGVDLTFPSSINLVARFQVASGNLFDASHPPVQSATTSTTAPEGVFTGVGFGIHDNQRMYFCGVLLVNGVEHVGLLLNPKRPREVASWTIGPKSILTASKQALGTLPTVQVPVGFMAGSRFQVLTGAQAGVYTATSVVAQTNGVTTVEFTPPLPAAWDKWGQKYPEVFFETRATSKPFTYRLDIHSDQQVAELRISGETQGVVASIDGNVPMLPPPAQTSLLLPVDGAGQVFWGSLSRQAASRATWSFIRYGIIPDQVFLQGHVVAVNTEMGVLPENDPSAPWFPRQDFGEASIGENVDTMLLKTGVSHSSLNFTFGYSRIEPFLFSDALFDLEAKVSLDSGILGSGDIELTLDDTQRLAKVVPLLYQEGFGGTTDRRLVNLPAVSTTGFTLPETLGWEVTGTLAATVEGAQLVTVQTAADKGGWTQDLNGHIENVVLTDEGHLFEARLAVTAHQANGAGDTGIRFGGQMPGTVGNAVVQVELVGGGVPSVVLKTAAAVVQVYPFDWTDGETHTYRVIADWNASTVTLVVDDAVQLPVANLAAFDGGVNTVECFFGCYGVAANNLPDPTLSCTVEWHHFHCHVLPPASAKRTLGVWLGGDKNDINSFEIPRIDTSTAPNSWDVGPVLREMDWRQRMEIRVLHDPGWGITVFRPDLPPPPYYQPEDGQAGHGFITDTDEPSAGWINVEYPNLPRSPGTTLGLVSFGALDSRSISQSRWDWVRYRMARHPTEDRIAPEHMLLNQFNVITSGELTTDTGLETVIVQALDWQRATLLPAHMYAKAVYKILDDRRVFTSDMWTFDPAAQLVTLLPDTDGTPRFFGYLDEGIEGTFGAAGKTFTDLTADFLSLEVGNYLHVLFGDAAGAYEIRKVVSATVLEVAKPFPTTSQAAMTWVATAAQTSLTIMFVPGQPVTNTYLLNQPLLQGVTKLNEGTPPVPMSQTAESEIEIVFGSLLNDPEDVLNLDPAFVLNDPYRTLRHKDVEGSLYEKLDFYQVTDEGQTGLLAAICEGGPGTGFSGLSPTEGEDIYSPTGTGAPLNGTGQVANFFATGDKVGKAVGAEVFDFSGTRFWQDANFPASPDWTQKGGSPGGILFASGGKYVNPVVDGTGKITGALVAAGGTLGPGTAVLWPSFPARGPVGGDQGRIYKRTDWLLRIDPDEDFGTKESFSLAGADATPPSRPAFWESDPDGTPHALGKAYGLLEYPGQYSRIGPWGGLKNLTPDHDYGTFRVVVPVDGHIVRIWDPVPAVWVTFTAKNGPVGPTEFAVAPTPHVALAAVINAYPFSTGFVATAGLTLGGQLMVRVEAETAVDSILNPLYLQGPSPAGFQLADVILLPGNIGLLMGGSGMTQSSLLAGGTQLGNITAVPNPARGMVAQGGAALPQGVQLNLTFQAV